MSGKPNHIGYNYVYMYQAANDLEVLCDRMSDEVLVELGKITKIVH